MGTSPSLSSTLWTEIEGGSPGDRSRAIVPSTPTLKGAT